MEKLKLIFVLTFCLLLNSCDIKDLVPDLQSIDTEEAVEMIKSSLSERSAGLAEITAENVRSFVREISQNIECDQTTTDSYSKNTDDLRVEANYSFSWSFTVNCNAFSVPQNANFASTGSGTYATARIQSEDSSSINTEVTGLQPSASELIYNGVYSRNGTQQISTNQTNKTVNSVFEVDLTDLIVDKSDEQIKAGTGTFTLSGTSDGAEFDYEGSITFNGEGSVFIVINGNEYTIELD